MNGLLTDLYELAMAAGYFETGKVDEKATFELVFRRLPANRNFLLTAGLHHVVDYLLNLSFTSEDIDYLRGLRQFANISPAFFDYLRDFRFTGDLFAAPEGTPMFPGEPVAVIRAPIIEAQIPETFLLSTIGFQTMIATKAGADRRGRRGPVCGRVRNPPRPHARSRRVRRARRLHRRLRRHQQHPRRTGFMASRSWAPRRTPG